MSTLALEMLFERIRKAAMNEPTPAVNELPALLVRARAEFSEMPGMCLTVAQAARLWRVTPDDAQQLLSELVQTGFLIRRDGQRYLRPSSV
jgi:hypothetical protein